jgi:hypothetical protein
LNFIAIFPLGEFTPTAWENLMVRGSVANAAREIEIARSVAITASMVILPNNASPSYLAWCTAQIPVIDSSVGGSSKISKTTRTIINSAQRTIAEEFANYRPPVKKADILLTFYNINRFLD